MGIELTFAPAPFSPAVARIAKIELGECEEVREAALAELRERIRETGLIHNCRQDSNFLLRFLRHSKFNVPLAHSTLLKYVKMRQEESNWFQQNSMDDPKVLDLINRGVAFALPERDKEGRRVIFSIGANIDPHRHSSEDVMRAMMVVLESLLEDEENQVQGFTYILDESNVTLSHLAKLWCPSDLVKLWGMTEKGLPVRHKSINFTKLPLILSAVFSFAKNLLPSKMQKRMRVLKSEGEMRRIFEGDILPKEYGGRVPMADMIGESQAASSPSHFASFLDIFSELFKQEIKGRQKNLLELDNMTIS